MKRRRARVFTSFVFTPSSISGRNARLPGGRHSLHCAQCARDGRAHRHDPHRALRQDSQAPADVDQLLPRMDLLLLFILVHAHYGAHLRRGSAFRYLFDAGGTDLFYPNHVSDGYS